MANWLSKFFSMIIRHSQDRNSALAANTLHTSTLSLQIKSDQFTPNSARLEHFKFGQTKLPRQLKSNWGPLSKVVILLLWALPQGRAPLKGLRVDSWGIGTSNTQSPSMFCGTELREILLTPLKASESMYLFLPQNLGDAAATSSSSLSLEVDREYLDWSRLSSATSSSASLEIEWENLEWSKVLSMTAVAKSSFLTYISAFTYLSWFHLQGESPSVMHSTGCWDGAGMAKLFTTRS